ncbi:MAG: 4Fe-4S binding protein [Methanoregulaceae archaeon]|jgi:formate hydrogenlyase subunit 6/NADH:ubiquinone oxidoreductase subunit I|nr:4Fe-4S binding protein [Methanoregulaceae archaeon]MCU0628477.1 4Fe-4S binding protein [Methanoregulaceae archaeon]
MAFFEMAKTAIRTVVSRPATLMYPARPGKKTGLSRGHVVIDPSRCISCGMCMKKCPSEAICVEKDERIWRIDRLRCVVCNSCIEVCPVKCLRMDLQYSPALLSHSGLETFLITYVKPERPKKSETGENADA